MPSRALSSRALAVSVLLLASAAALAGDGMEISSSTVDGGGGTLTGTTFELTGTIGQPDAGPPLASGSFELRGGFWAAPATAMPACPGDVSGDGAVSVDDLVVVILDWGLTGTPAGDADGNGVVDVDDLVVVVLNWGPCPLAVACCFDDGTCLGVSDEPECSKAGGHFIAGSTCDDVDCTQGACCLDDGIGDCGPSDPKVCAGMFGSYTPGATCFETCVGACCLPDGCCEAATQEQCEANGGSYQGSDTLPCQFFCQQTGACCLFDGCVVTTLGGCEGFEWHGCGTTCEDAPVCNGACCLPDGTCIDGAKAGYCDSMGGIPQGEGTTCAEVTCKP